MGVAELERTVHDEAATRCHAARKLVIIQLAGQAYGIRVDTVCEILPMPRLSQPPGLPRVLAGFLNLGGQAIPVVKLARLFGLDELAPGLYTPLLLVRWADQPVAILVDAIQGIVSVDELSIVPLPDNLCFNNCAEGLATVGGTNVVLLSDRRLLHEQERQRYGELAAIEQARLADVQEAHE
jgi:purine-binding chemotaxis protein CheW